MKRIFVLGLATLMALSCSQNKTAVVEAAIDGADSKNIIVSQLSVNQLKFVDSVKTDNNGKMTAKIAINGEAPNFYYLSYNGRRLASMVLRPGDKVKVSADTLGRNVTIEGSEESALMQKYDLDLASAILAFEASSAELGKAVEANDAELVQQLNSQLSKMYVKYKQDIIKSIMMNPYSLANVQALYQSIAPGLPVFGSENDRFIFQRVHDSLQTVYPNSVYVKSLQEQIKAVEDMKLLEGQFANAGETSFPNISLPDINAKNVDLTSLEGKPFVLMFWTMTDASQKMFNNDLIEIYNKYKASGLQVYQVSIDTDKTAWATVVKEQKLPWISVCDGKGIYSTAVSTYNVGSVPAVFVFDKNGDIVGTVRSQVNKQKVEELVKKAVR